MLARTATQRLHDALKLAYTVQTQQNPSATFKTDFQQRNTSASSAHLQHTGWTWKVTLPCDFCL